MTDRGVTSGSPMDDHPSRNAVSEVDQRLERTVRQTQADARIPALSVALHRADRPLWTFTVGDSGRAQAPLDPRSQFRIGSVTKTFTAVLILQCRDDGLLDLDDPVGAHLDLPAHTGSTVRRLLSHTAGLQREPYGDVWDSLDVPDLPRLLADLRHAEQVLPPARRYHYSNLAFALLGHVAAKLRGGTWEEVLAERILAPLALTGTTVPPDDRAVVGYLVDVYSDHAHPEPQDDVRALGPAAQLWSTAADMARWAAFLADPAAVDPAGRLLAPATLDEMRWPVTATEEARWTSGYGLGLRLVPQGDPQLRTMHVGHTGAMPGFLAGVFGRRGGAGTPGGMGCAVLGSSGTADRITDLPHRLLAISAELDPVEITPWTPGEPAPDAYRSVLGRWWSEGYEYVFRWRAGSLQAHGAGDPAGTPPAVFAPLPDQPDVLRTVAGREAGELLRLTRDETGTVVCMHWSTYRYTRCQETFSGRPAGGW